MTDSPGHEPQELWAPGELRSLVMSDPKGRELLERVETGEQRKREREQRYEEIREAKAQQRAAWAARPPREKLLHRIKLTVVALVAAGGLTVWVMGGAPTFGGDTAPVSAPPAPSVSQSATEVDPATGEIIPAAGTSARDAMEARETACFDAGRTDCAENPGTYLDGSDSYP